MRIGKFLYFGDFVVISDSGVAACGRGYVAGGPAAIARRGR